MFPLLEVGTGILSLFPVFVLDPFHATVFLLITAMVWVQYRRIEVTERALYGAPKNRAFRQALASVGEGVAAGYLGSLLAVVVGVTLGGSGVGYLLPVALVLMAINPRLLCYSYAGALVSLAHLLTGVPSVDVPGVMALVAVLHGVESLLITFGGTRASTPVHLRHGTGHVVGGFGLQRFWPVPLVLLAVEAAGPVEGALQMPAWWPLIQASPPTGADVYGLLPVVAVLGYADLAATTAPARKARFTAGLLALYSASLLALAVLASREPALRWAAVAFAALGHEAVVAVGSRRELWGRPLYRWEGAGAVVLDVLPGSPAAQVGIRAGDLVLAPGGHPPPDRGWVEAALSEGTATVLRGGRPVRLRGSLKSAGGPSGLIMAPRGGDEPNVVMRGSGPLARAASRLGRSLWSRR